MRILLATLLLLACGCAGQPTAPAPSAPEPRLGLSTAEADRLASEQFKMSLEGLGLLQQQKLTRARAMFRTALTALTERRYDRGLHDLERVRSLIELPLRNVPLASERGVVLDLIRKAKHWQAEARRETQQRRKAAARNAATGY